MLTPTILALYMHGLALVHDTLFERVYHHGTLPTMPLDNLQSHTLSMGTIMLVPQISVCFETGDKGMSRRTRMTKGGMGLGAAPTGLANLETPPGRKLVLLPPNPQRLEGTLMWGLGAHLVHTWNLVPAVTSRTTVALQGISRLNGRGASLGWAS